MENDVRIYRIGRIGFWVALSPWIALVATFACAAAGVPGFG